MPTRVMARLLMVALALALCNAVSLAADDPPVVVAVDPDEPTTPYVEFMDIYGANFVAPVKVEFGEQASTSSELLSPGHIRSQVPYGFGNVDIVVTSGPGQQKALFERGISSLNPVVHRLEPYAARAGDQVTIYGQDLFPDTAQSVKFGSASAPIVSQTPSQVEVQVPPGGGTVNISLSNTDGKTSILEGGFTYLPFVGAGINPVAARVGSYVTITGQGFLDTRVYYVVFGGKFSGEVTTDVVVVSPNTIRARVPQPKYLFSSAAVDVEVRDIYTGGRWAYEDAFTYLPSLAPVVVDIAPDAARTPSKLTITGSGLDGSEKLVLSSFWGSTVWLDKDKFSSSPTSITVSTPYLPHGPMDVTVLKEDIPFVFYYLEGRLAGGFTVLPMKPPPVPQAITPTAANPGTTVTISGADFDNPRVRFGEKADYVKPVSWTSTSIRVNVPAGTGTVDVFVRAGPSQIGVLYQAFAFGTVPPPPAPAVAPNVNGIDPPGGGATQGVYITGTGFVHKPAVEFGGSPATFIEWLTPEWLLVGAPEGTGTVDVKVTNPGGGLSSTLADAFTYASAPPRVDEVLPIEAKSGFGIDIYGANFVNTTEVEFGAGNAATAVGIVDSGRIFAVVPPGTGTVDIIVRNPLDGSESVLENAFTYAFAAPTVDSVSPNAGKPVRGIYITGTGFMPTPEVEFGPENPAEFVCFQNPTRIFVVAPYGSGTVDIIITNSDGGSVVVEDGFTYDEGP